MSERRVQLLVAFGYDGARFRGLQPQPDQPTAGGALRQRFEVAGVWPKALCFAARTDAGVHALHNVATCWLEYPRALEETCAAVMAPRDDGLRDVVLRRVPIKTHARAIATGKHYRYRLEHSCDTPPPIRPDRWSVVPHLDAARMQAAAQHLVGSHDFSAFRVRAPGPQSAVRQVDRIAVSAHGTELTVDVVGRSFLRQMVRIIVGTLAEVGSGWRPEASLLELLRHGQRREAGIAAPAAGLTLVEVFVQIPES